MLKSVLITFIFSCRIFSSSHKSLFICYRPMSQPMSTLNFAMIPLRQDQLLSLHSIQSLATLVLQHLLQLFLMRLYLYVYYWAYYSSFLHYMYKYKKPTNRNVCEWTMLFLFSYFIAYEVKLRERLYPLSIFKKSVIPHSDHIKRCLLYIIRSSYPLCLAISLVKCLP